MSRQPRALPPTMGLLALVVAACSPAAPLPTSTPPAPPTPTVTPPPRSAEVAEIQRQVEARARAQAQWQSAAVGEQVAVGGGVRTGEDSRARLDISDGTVLRLGANTEFELAALSPEPTDATTRFNLTVGKVWARVTQALGGGSFEIEAASGTATVRGSHMSVEFFSANGHMIVTCLEGECRLTSTTGQFTDLNAGEQSEIPAFGEDPTPPQTIDAAQKEDWEQEVPEARDLVATVTPGPPPTDTPTATSTPTQTPTLTPTPTATPIAVAGRWTGTTDEGWAITFDVTADGMVSDVSIEPSPRIPCGGTFFVRFTWRGEVAIVNDQFTTRGSGPQSRAEGRFDSATTASGTFSFDTTLPNGCQVSRSGTWEAEGP
jgi:hypothetical protein